MHTDADVDGCSRVGFDNPGVCRIGDARKKLADGGHDAFGPKGCLAQGGDTGHRSDDGIQFVGEAFCDGPGRSDW